MVDSISHWIDKQAPVLAGACQLVAVVQRVGAVSRDRLRGDVTVADVKGDHGEREGENDFPVPFLSAYFGALCRHSGYRRKRGGICLHMFGRQFEYDFLTSIYVSCWDIYPASRNGRSVAKLALQYSTPQKAACPICKQLRHSPSICGGGRADLRGG